MPIPLGVLAVAGAGAAGAAGAYELLETVLVGSGGQNDITFSNLNSTYGSTYQHLQIRIVGIAEGTANTAVWQYVQFNADTGSNYASHSLAGNGTSVTSGASTSAAFMRLGQLPDSSQTGFGAIVMDILDPFETTKNTTARGLSGIKSSGYNYIALTSGFWNNTAALTSIKLYLETGVDYAQYSRISLYGLRSA